MTTYTHFFNPALAQDGVMGAVFPLDDYERIVADHVAVRAMGGMVLLTPDYKSTVVSPYLSKPWRRIDSGSSWLHVRNGYICAGAGGLNSMPVRALR